MVRELFYPCLATFMCALPYAYRNIPAAPGTIINVTIAGDTGGSWFLQKSNAEWQFVNINDKVSLAATITLPPDMAWKLFTKAIPASVAKANSIITGDTNLAGGIFNMIAVMA